MSHRKTQRIGAREPARAAVGNIFQTRLYSVSTKASCCQFAVSVFQTIACSGRSQSGRCFHLKWRPHCHSWTEHQMPCFTARHNTVNSFSSLHVHPEFLGSKVDRRLNCCPSRLSSCLRERPHLHARVHLAVCVQVQAEGSAREETIGEAEWKGQWLKGRTSAR